VTRPDDSADLLTHAAWVHRLARALLRDDALAQDVAQETLAAAIEQRPAFAGPQQLRGWLRTVVRRIAFAARRARHERLLREAHAARTDGDDVERQAADQLALHEELTAAVQALPEPYRTAVTLRFFADLTPRAIAQRCATSSVVVRQRVHRGLALLRERLDRNHGSRAAWAEPFAAALPPTLFPSLFLVPLMIKQWLAAALVLLAVAAGAWIALPEPAAPPAPIDQAAATPTAAAMATDAVATPVGGAAAAAAPDRVDAHFELVVVDAANAPLAAAEVHCWTDGAEPVVGRTDGRGRARFAASPRPGGAVVLASGHAPCIARLDSLLGERSIALADGAAVAGRVLVDGSPASSGLRLLLSMPPIDDDSLPKAIEDLLARPAATSTDADGRFAFRGLSPTWRGQLRLPPTHWLLTPTETERADDRKLDLPRPTSDLVVATTKLQVIAGRVVWSDDGSAVPAASVMGKAIFVDSTTGTTTSVEADDTGRFEMAVVPVFTPSRERWRQPENRIAIDRAELMVHAPGSGGGHLFEFDARTTHVDDVVVELPRAKQKHFLAVDERGAPVAGARVKAGELSAPTGVDGRGTFHGDAQLIGAPAHRTAVAEPRAQARGDRDDPWVFVLASGGDLRLRFRTPTGEPYTAGHIQLHASGPIFAGAPSSFGLHRALAIGLAGCSYERADGPMDLQLAPDRNGEVVLPSPLPQLACTIEVSDALRERLVAHDFTTSSPAVTTTIDVEVPATRRIVRGHVADAAGRPLRDAIVRLRPLGARSFSASRTTDDAGSFVFPPVANEGPLELQAERRGYVAEVRPLSPGVAEAEFRLLPGRRVEVRAIDDRGTLVPCAIRARNEDGTMQELAAQMLAPGHFVFGCIARRPVAFVCTLGGREFTTEPPADATTAELRLPTMARVTLAPPPAGFPPPANGSLGVRAQCVDPVGAAIELTFPRPGDKPLLLPPGAYTFRLVHREWLAAERRTVVTELAAAAELRIAAAADVTVVLN
jgi:RNA polymerase sigma-70 factor (ECF subfamily)